MKLQEYIEATQETAIYPQTIAFLYILTKGAGEVGELLNKVGKVLRGDFTLNEIKDGLVEELGGVYWYIAQLIRQYNSESVSDSSKNNISLDVTQISRSGSISDVDSIIYAVNTIQGVLKEFIDIYRMGTSAENKETAFSFVSRQFAASSNGIPKILKHLDLICGILGITPEEVMQRNINLLQARKQSGTIQGHNRQGEVAIAQSIIPIGTKIRRSGSEYRVIAVRTINGFEDRLKVTNPFLYTIKRDVDGLELEVSESTVIYGIYS